jgi:hypothetical protein
MSSQLRVFLAVIGWLTAVTILHLWLNTHVLDLGSGQTAQSSVRFRVGFLPVT